MKKQILLESKQARHGLSNSWCVLLQLVSPDDLVNAAKLFSSVKIPLR